MDLPSGTPSWILVVLAVAIVATGVLKAAAELSESAARWIPFGQRLFNRAQAKSDSIRREREAVREERDAVLDSLTRDIERIDKQLQASIKREEQLQRAIAQRDAYDAYRDEQTAKLRDALTEQGIDMPRLLTRTEWEHEQAMDDLRSYYTWGQDR